MSALAAAQLIGDDSRASRGLVDEQAIIEEQKELEHELQEEHERAGEADLSAQSLEPPRSSTKAYFSFDRSRRSLDLPAHRKLRGRRDRAYWTNVTINLGLIGAWYLFSSLLQLYNKWMFSPDHYNFEAPLFVTSFHMVVQFCLSALVLFLMPRLRPDSKPEPRDYLFKAGPCGLATGLDIGFSNLSLEMITLSFYTMCKSSSLGFVLFFAILFRLERLTWRLVGIITLITCGVILMVSAETKFSLVGMILVLTASAMSGLRWSITQLLLDKQAMGFTNPIATLFWLAPIMAITLGICSIIFEGFSQVFGNPDFFGSFGSGLQTMGLILLPGVMAFCMTTSEFTLISRTSVVTLSVAGIFKEVLTIFISTVVFHDELTPINISGLCVTIFGIALYNYLKFREYDTVKNSPKENDGHAFVNLPHRDEGGRDIESRLPLADHKANGVALFHSDEGYEERQHEIGSDDSGDEGLDLDDGEINGPHVRLLPRHSAEDHQIAHLDEELRADPGLRELSRKQQKIERALEKPASQQTDEEWTLFDEDARRA